MQYKRAVIFANGDLPNDGAALALIQPGDLLIAADGGGRHMLRLGLTPHLLIGDLDSLEAGELEQLADLGAEVRRFPVEKDETDLELALREAYAHGCQKVIIAAGLGGRLDHTLGNVYLLLQASPVEVRLDDGRVEAFWIRGKGKLDGHTGDTVSLLPLMGPAVGITTQGLRYPLKRETLFPEHTRGISNEMLGVEASVELESGLLLCLHERQNRN